VRPEWERGLRGRFYALGRRLTPLALRRALRRRFSPEKLLGIRKPEIDIPRFEFDPEEALPGRPDVVFLPVIAWSYRRQRPQQLAEALGRRGRRVFYGAIRGPGEPEQPVGAAPGVLLLPIAGVRREDPADRRLEGRALEEAFASIAGARDRYGLFEAALVVETPFWAPLAFRLSERFGWKVVYDCLDAHAAFSANRPGVLAQAEEDLARRADLVVATSEVLRSRLAGWSPGAELLPNGCDAELFAGVPDRPPGSEPLNVGYVGALDEWFDTDLFVRLARLRPRWHFEIVGGNEGGRAPFAESLANVAFLGERPHAELPGLRARFDVEIIPFLPSPLTHAVDPVKLYEAAAAGRPVVASRLQALEPFAKRGLARLASTAEEFADAIEAAASAGSAERERLRAFARENTWDHRAERLDAWLRELYPRVSVVVVTRDGLAMTRLCLASLDRRTSWPNLELVFVDNGSTDGTREWLEEEAARRGEAFRVIAFPENRGFATAANAGASAAGGDYLCFLNNDTVVTGGWLSALLRHCERDPSLGMIGPSTNEIANAAKVPVGYRDPAELEPWARAFTREGDGRAEPIDMLAFFCVLLRRRVFETVGPLDERFAVGMFEDDDYCRRLRDGGWRLAVARDSFVHHWGRGSFRRLPEEEYSRIYRENRERYERKWGTPPAR
jgi:GT2 family glycosyltransferase/glycosyltransferase involved in cell wall biosynthesis